MKCYVINMKSDTGRIKDMKKKMGKLGIEFERWNAIDGNSINDDDYREYIRYGHKLGRGEVGCLLSHILLWERIKKNNLDYAIIFEDDIDTYLSEQKIKSIIDKAVNNLPSFDIFYLGKCADACYLYEHMFDNIYRTYHPTCLHAYIITAAGVSKLLSKLPTGNAIDIVVRNNIEDKTLVAYTCHPSIFYQDVITYSSNLRDYSYENINECAPCRTPEFVIPRVARWVIPLLNIFFIIFFILVILVILYFLSNRK